jgi:general stress protein YciG
MQKELRGFARLSPEERRKVSGLGGRTAHQMGRAHQFTPEEAREAGKKGGLVTGQRRKAVR